MTPSPDALLMTLSRIEAESLAGLVAQFVELLESTDDTDDAVERLAPDAYPDDAEAASEFRSATRADLLDARRVDAAAVLASLSPAEPATEPASDAILPSDLVDIALSPDDGWAWMRTLTAIRLVLASRLGIDEQNPEGTGDDDSTAIYDWLGYRLEGLVQALSND